jgi:DMSO reductase anchor subunit
MHPAFSVIFFTTLAGAAQGLVVFLAVAALAGVVLPGAFVGQALFTALVLLVAGLGSSFFHLGHPKRAWRAVLMWRTSWMSREVIVLPAFIALVGLWWLLGPAPAGAAALLLPAAAIAGAALLWYCTAMIYACLRFIREWAHPLTLVNYTLIGLSSGLVLGGALAALTGEPGLARHIGGWALAATALAALARLAALRRNAALAPVSTLQSATGIRAARLVQKSMGMSAGAFNTREFFHGASQAMVRHIRHIAIGLGFAAPLLCLVWGLAGGGVSAWVLALLLQAPGLLAERWLFFAQARHPQNLYYQVVS